MPRELQYSVETRQCGEPWRVMWRGPGMKVAWDGAWDLACKTRAIEGYDVVVHVSPYVRVRQGKTVVLSIVHGKQVS